jgi:hypothetical protein
MNKARQRAFLESHHIYLTLVISASWKPRSLSAILLFLFGARGHFQKFLLSVAPNYEGPGLQLNRMGSMINLGTNATRAVNFS